MCSTHCVPTSESFQWYGREIRKSKKSFRSLYSYVDIEEPEPPK